MGNDAEFSVIVVNLRGKVRHEVVHGRHYLVAPATLIVPGVLNGSRGALFYPKGEVSRNEGIWNHTPITVGHPTDPLTNLPVSGRVPDTLNRVGIGYVFNDRIGRDGERQADLYFDIQLTYNYDRKNGTDILWRVENGLPIELSTGLYTDNEPARNGATDDKGRPYDYIARNYRPDHLAVLVNDRGACSVLDGCGVNVHNAELNEALWEMETMTENIARKAEVDPRWLPEAYSQYIDLAEAYRSPTANNDELRAMVAEQKAAYFEGLMQVTQNADKEGSTVEFCPDCGKRMLTQNCPCGYTKNLEMSGTGAAGSPLKVGLGGGGEGGGTEEPTSNDDENKGDGYKIPPMKKSETIVNASGGTDDALVGIIVRNSGGQVMPLTVNQRKGIVDDLCANCDCYKGQSAILNQLPDDNLIRLKEQAIQSRNNAVVADTVKNGLRIRDTAGRVVTVNAGVKEGKLVVNAFGTGGVGEKAEGSNASTKASNGPDIQAGGEEDDTVHAGVHSIMEGSTVKAKGLPPGHGVQNALMNDPWFRQAPPYIQQMLLTNAAREEEYRRKLAEQIVPSYVTGQVRNQLVANKLKLDTADLELELKVLNQQQQMQPAYSIPSVPLRTPNYAGAGVTANGGAFVDNSGEPDLLDLPKMSW